MTRSPLWLARTRPSLSTVVPLLVAWRAVERGRRAVHWRLQLWRRGRAGRLGFEGNDTT